MVLKEFEVPTAALLPDDRQMQVQKVQQAITSIRIGCSSRSMTECQGGKTCCRTW